MTVTTPRTRAQVVRFLISGVLATAADAAVYFALVHTVLDGRWSAAKSVSFVVGTAVAWVLATTWTFAGTQRGARRAGAFFALYALAFAVNVGGNRAALAALFAAGVPEALAEPVAFVAATGCSTVLNFLGQKLVVFRDA
jgi:putative flippase GtrA